MWQHRDETGNFLQKHDVEIIKEEKRSVCMYMDICVLPPSTRNGPQQIIICGVVNGSSPVLSHVVETRQDQGALELTLQANKRVTHAYTS